MKKLLLMAVALLNIEANAQELKAYQNYDFVPGSKLIFSDDFSDSESGEFGVHWKLAGGQAVVNKVEDEPAFFITKYYTVLTPRIKTPNYLPKEFTIEFDTWLDAKYDSNNGLMIHLKNGEDNVVSFSTNNSYLEFNGPGQKLNGEYPASLGGDNYFNKWHHFAIAVKGSQIKVYCDQYRILSVPECDFIAKSLVVAGDASDGMNMMFKNFKLAEGGGMNMIGKAFTDGKYISHGINFAVNSAAIRPESAGEINAIAKILKENAALKVEIGGYTDSDGNDEANLKLSAQRAEAVKNQLTGLGIEGTRLMTKGYGETKPLADNATFEGKAQNRRVEFVKIP